MGNRIPKQSFAGPLSVDISWLYGGKKTAVGVATSSAIFGNYDATQLPMPIQFSVSCFLDVIPHYAPLSTLMLSPLPCFYTFCYPYNLLQYLGLRTSSIFDWALVWGEPERAPY